MTKKFLLILIVLMGLVFLSFNYLDSKLPLARNDPQTKSSSQSGNNLEANRACQSGAYQPELKPVKAEMEVNGRRLLVEIVKTPAGLSRGLSGRDDIGSDGMLFVFPDRQIRSFWMREMKFDLDLIWIAGDKVVGVTRGAPAPDPTTPLNQLPRYYSPRPADKVLEIVAGQADELKIEPGTQIWLDYD